MRIEGEYETHNLIELLERALPYINSRCSAEFFERFGYDTFEPTIEEAESLVQEILYNIR